MLREQTHLKEWDSLEMSLRWDRAWTTGVEGRRFFSMGKWCQPKQGQSGSSAQERVLLERGKFGVDLNHVEP